MKRRRDDELGTALRRLDVPGHRPGFFPDLVRRLEAEARSAGRPAFEPRPRRPWWLPPRPLIGVATALVVVGVAAAVLLPGKDGGVQRPGGDRPGPGGTTPAPQLISAVEVRARVAAAFSSATSLRGEISVTCEIEYYSCSPAEGGSRRWSFVAGAGGDERVTGIGHTEDIAYRPSTGVQREVRDFGSGLERYEFTGLAVGPPDSFVGSPVLRRQLGSVVRAFLADRSEVPVTEAVVDGRPVWQLSAPVSPNKLAGPGRSPDRLDVAVDRETGFPVRVTATLAGRRLYQIRLSSLVVSSPVDPSEFTVVFSDGVLFREDRGFRRVPLDQVAATVGYQPLVPRDLPAGYRLAEVTVAAQGPFTGTEGSNPPAPNVVNMVFRRGFDRILVSTRSTGPDPAAWSDPLSSGEGVRDVPEPFTISSGALAGTRAELVLNVTSLPHVWAVTDGLVVTVAGDASAPELRRMAASF